MSEETIKDFLFRKGAANRVPVSGTFELTSRCNFSCEMCYIHMEPWEQCRAGRELTTGQWMTLGREAVDAGLLYLLLTGGEPLLRPDFPELYTGLIQMGLRITINTNGSLVTPEIVECFRKYPPEKINVSMYGASEETYRDLCANGGGYKKALRGIRILKDAGIRVNLNTTFTRRNAHEMPKIVAFAKEEGIPLRTAAHVFPPVRNGHEEDAMILTPEEMGCLAAEFDWLTLNEEQKQHRLEIVGRCADPEAPAGELTKNMGTSCMAGKGSFWVSWDGMMYPCGMLSENGTNVVQTGFAQAWKETVEKSKALSVPSGCVGCRMRPVCPVCAAVQQTSGCGTGSVPEDQCIRTRAYIRTLLEKGRTYDPKAQ